MTRSPVITVLCLLFLALCGIGLTAASFHALIVPAYRSLTFYCAMTSLCFAEFVLFGYLAYMATVPQSVKRPSPAVRMRIMVLVIIWFLVVLITSIVAVHPSTADTYFSDKIIIWQAIATFLCILGSFFLHWQDVNIQQRDDAPQRERVRLESYAGGVSSLLATLRRSGDRHPDSALQVDRAMTKLDTLKSHLLSVSPMAERPTERLVPGIDVAKVESQLTAIHSSFAPMGQLDERQFEVQLTAICEQVDAVIELLRHREDAITF